MAVLLPLLALLLLLASHSPSAAVSSGGTVFSNPVALRDLFLVDAEIAAGIRLVLEERRENRGDEKENGAATDDRDRYEEEQQLQPATE